jgi:predicted amino acid dehydrogenase
MTNKQPEALRLAEFLDLYKSNDGYEWKRITECSASELRRLHEVNAELLEVLKYVRATLPHDRWADDSKRMADAIIAKATGGYA